MIYNYIATAQHVGFSKRIERFGMKKVLFALGVLVSAWLMSTSVFAASRTIQVDGENIVVETIGNAEFCEPDTEVRRGKRSVEYFEFYINDYVETALITNRNRKWRVQTHAYLRDNLTGETDASGRMTYTVSIRDASGRALFSYRGKTDDVYGGVTFSKVPKRQLRISVSKKKSGNWFLKGEGDTQFLD